MEESERLLKRGVEMNSFEKKLAARVAAGRKRVESVEHISELRGEVTLRRVKLDLEPRPVTGEEIKSVRKMLRASQAVFAAYIQVPKRTLQEWEQGRSVVPGCAARLIGEMLRDPVYWTDSFKKVIDRSIV